MDKQNTSTILMIEPVAFNYNEETAVNNYFQIKSTGENTSSIQQKALDEFNQMVQKLRSKDITILVIKDTLDPPTPDSIFPNNWISFHQNNNIALYPMYAKNRRNERREDILNSLEEQGFIIEEVYDYTTAEEENIFLEGTGSIILDRENKIAYAAISERTDEELFIEFCEDFEFTPIIFKANQTVNNQRLPIYHTNVMMCVGSQYVVICLESIDDKKERKQITEIIKKTGKEILSITEAQMHQFAGNMLQVENNVGTKFLVMSQAAYDSLNTEQRLKLESFNEIITVNLSTIEKYGGGSARCMMAEIFLSKTI